MAKSASRSLRSEPAVPLVGARGRAAEHPGTVGVSDLPQAKTVDLNIARQFDVPPQGQGPNKLPERPRTSNGPARNFSSTRRNPDKRETRDDLHLNVNPLAAHGKGTTFYDFPLPGSSPQSVSIPRSLSPAPFPQRKSSLAGSIRSRHSGSVKEETMEMEDPMDNIGMALGSPSHPPAQSTQAPWNQNQKQSQNQTPNQPSQHVRFNNVRVASPEEMDSSMDGWDRVDASAPPTKQKSKWSLGRLFGGGKKHTAPPTQPFYQVQPENGVQRQATGSSDFGSPPVSANEKPKGRGRTNSERKDVKNKPDMKRANTAPHRGPTDFEYGNEGKNTPQLMLDGGPMLDVDIPSVHMERYSVMFGSVLKPNASSSSALLARRQATLDKLKTVNEALREKERELEEKEEQLLRPRRATSPQPGKSPAFSLFPNTPSRSHTRDPSPSTPHNRSPLQRSNTAPSVSPSRANFEASRKSNEEPVPKVKPVLKAPPIIPPQKPLGRSLSNSNGKPKHQPIVTQFSQEESHLDLTSPHSSVMSYENDVYDPSPLPMLNMKPTIVSPAWEMVNPHPTAGAGSTSSGSTLNSASSAATSVNSPVDTLAVPRGRAGTVTNSTISTTSMEVPIAFAQPPTRDRIPAMPSKLKTSTEATDVPAPSRPTIQGHHKSDSAVTSLQKANSLAQSTPQTSHSKDDSISGFSIVSSKGEIVGLSEDEQRIINAADVSIARQISVSRQQRQLLIPIKKSNSTSPSPTSQNGSSPFLPTSNQRSASGPDLNQPSPLGSNKYGPSVISMPINLTGGADHTSRPRIKVKTELTGLGERLVDSPVRAFTPTVVVVPGPADIRKGPQVRKGSPVGAGNAGGLTVGGGNMELQHRKSARGVVEHA